MSAELPLMKLDPGDPAELTLSRSSQGSIVLDVRTRLGAVQVLLTESSFADLMFGQAHVQGKVIRHLTKRGPVGSDSRDEVVSELQAALALLCSVRDKLKQEEDSSDYYRICAQIDRVHDLLARRSATEDNPRTEPPVTLALSDGEIADKFAGTNFGSAGQTAGGRRGLVVECVLKRAAGYADGSTISRICRDFGLLDAQSQPTREGIRWAFGQIYESGRTIVERLDPEWRSIADGLAGALERLDALYRDEQDPEAPALRPEWLRHPMQRYKAALDNSTLSFLSDPAPESVRRGVADALAGADKDDNPYGDGSGALSGAWECGWVSANVNSTTTP